MVGANVKEVVILSPPRRAKNPSGGILRPDFVGSQNDKVRGLGR